MRPLLPYLCACVVLPVFVGVTLVGSPEAPSAEPKNAEPLRSGTLPDAKQGAPGVSLRVLQAREVRQSFAPGVTLESPLVFVDDGPKIGSWLMFDLAFDGVPDSSRIVSVELLSASAEDELGTDLVGPMLAQAGGDVKKWQGRSILVHDAAPSIRWFVIAPPRKASTVDGTLVVRAKLAARRDTLTIKPTGAWKSLDHESVKGMNAEFRYSRPSGMGPYLDVRPRGVEEYIFSISPRPPQFRGRAKYSAADRNGVEFLLAKETPEGVDVSVQVLADITTIDATLVLKGHELPK